MNTARSTAEIRQAAVDAGWTGDPLADEMLRKLDELEAQAAGKKGPSAAMRWLAICACVLAAITGTSYTILIGTWKNAMETKDAEITHLRQQNAAQLDTATKNVQALVAAAEAAAKSNASAADLNNAAVNLYITKFQELLAKFQELLEENKKLQTTKEPIAPTGTEKKP